jgi:hypothetical protein
VFGSIKNYFSKGPVKTKPVEGGKTKEKEKDPLKSVLSPTKENGDTRDHPGTVSHTVDRLFCRSLCF